MIGCPNVPYFGRRTAPQPSASSAQFLPLPLPSWPDAGHRRQNGKPLADGFHQRLHPVALEDAGLMTSVLISKPSVSTCRSGFLLLAFLPGL